MHCFNRHLLPELKETVGLGVRGLFEEDQEILLHLWDRWCAKMDIEVLFGKDSYRSTTMWANWIDTLSF